MYSRVLQISSKSVHFRRSYSRTREHRQIARNVNPIISPKHSFESINYCVLNQPIFIDQCFYSPVAIVICLPTCCLPSTDQRLPHKTILRTLKGQFAIDKKVQHFAPSRRKVFIHALFESLQSCFRSSAGSVNGIRRIIRLSSIRTRMNHNDRLSVACYCRLFPSRRTKWAVIQSNHIVRRECKTLGDKL